MSLNCLASAISVTASVVVFPTSREAGRGGTAVRESHRQRAEERRLANSNAAYMERGKGPLGASSMPKRVLSVVDPACIVGEGCMLHRKIHRCPCRIQIARVLQLRSQRRGGLSDVQAASDRQGERQSPAFPLD